MNKIIFSTAVAVAAMIFAAACGQVTPKQTSAEQESIVPKQKLTSADIPGEIPWQGDFIEGYRYESRIR